MDNRNLYRAGFVAAIVSTLGWLAYILGSTSLPDLSGLDGREFFLAFQEARFTYLLYSWGGVLGALLTVPYVLAFHYATKVQGGVRTLATTSAVVGAVLTFLGFTKTLTDTYFVLPAALEASESQLEMIHTAARFAGNVFEVPWFFGSFLVYGLGVTLLAIHALQSAKGPKWVNIVGIVGGDFWNHLAPSLPSVSSTANDSRKPGEHTHDHRVVHWFVGIANARATVLIGSPYEL